MRTCCGLTNAKRGLSTFNRAILIIGGGFYRIVDKQGSERSIRITIPGMLTSDGLFVDNADVKRMG